MTSPGVSAEETAQALADQLAVAIAAPVVGTVDGAGTPCLEVPRSVWVAAARHARDRWGMAMLDWLSAVDEPDGAGPGVVVVLHVVGTSGPRMLRRVLLRTRVPEGDLAVPSITAVWPGAAWHERETAEMFGVDFPGFDDGSGLGLRPLLLPDGFEGTPLRKSFVLASRAAKAWPGAKEPGESDTRSAPGRRKLLPPGVPDPATWPRPVPGPSSDGDAATGAETGGEDGPAGAPDSGHADG